jgi:hypothetical protein
VCFCKKEKANAKEDDKTEKIEKNELKENKVRKDEDKVVRLKDS